VARVHRGRIRGQIVAREGDRPEAFARGGRELQAVAVVAGYADVVDVEAQTAVRGDPGCEVRDADRYVIDAGKNGCVRGGAGVTRRSDSGSCDQRELVGMADRFDGQIHVEVGPVGVVRLRAFDVRELRDRASLNQGNSENGTNSSSAPSISQP